MVDGRFFSSSSTAGYTVSSVFYHNNNENFNIVGNLFRITQEWDCDHVAGGVQVCDTNFFNGQVGNLSIIDNICDIPTITVDSVLLVQASHATKDLLTTTNEHHNIWYLPLHVSRNLFSIEGVEPKYSLAASAPVAGPSSTWLNQSGKGVGVLVTQPTYPNSAIHDYTIVTRSPAKNAGISVLGLSYDKLAIARPQGTQFDMGPYEFVEGSAPVLTTTVNGGNGTISPASSTRATGEVVTVTGTPNANFQVNAWTGTDTACTGQTTCVVTMTTSKTVTVSFSPVIAAPVLTTAVVGGNGSISPASSTRTASEVVALTASPLGGYHVKLWTGTDTDSACAGLTTCSVTMTGNKSVTVTFELTSVAAVTPLQNFAVITSPRQQGDIQSFRWDWTTDANGMVTTVATTDTYIGEVLWAVAIPGSGPTQPTNDYDIEVLNDADADLLGGGGADMANVGNDYPAQTNFGVASTTHLRLRVKNAGSEKTGSVLLDIK
jgi:hypothetical protein